MASGVYRQRVTVEASTETSDGHDGIVVTWAPVAPARRSARVVPLTGRDLERARQIDPRISLEVSLRYWRAYTNELDGGRARLVYHPTNESDDDRTLEIVTAPIDVEERHDELQILCREAAEMFTVTAEPTQAFVDAISVRLKADNDTTQTTSLITLLGGTMKVYGHLSEAARTAYPYLVLGRRGMNRDAGAMGLPGANVSLQVDVWSAYKGTLEVSRILSRVSRLLERYLLVVAGFESVQGSLTCEFSEVFDEPDADKPGERLYHGVQRWVAELHEAA